MEVKEFLERMNDRERVGIGSEMPKMMCELSNQAMQRTAELNNQYHTPEEIRTLFSGIIGKQVDESFMMFPPFYTDCRRNTTIGKNLFINACCNFQDHGGVTIGDGWIQCIEGNSNDD